MTNQSTAFNSHPLYFLCDNVKFHLKTNYLQIHLITQIFKALNFTNQVKTHTSTDTLLCVCCNIPVSVWQTHQHLSYAKPF